MINKDGMTVTGILQQKILKRLEEILKEGGIKNDVPILLGSE